MAENPEEKGKIDLDKILLPKKEVTPASAQRVNAAAALADQQTPPQGATPPPPKLQEPPQKKEEPVVQALHTYKSDIERIVQQKNVSVVSIAAAEAERRAAGSPSEPVPPTATQTGGLPMRRVAMLALGAILALGALGLLATAFLHPQSTSPLDKSLLPPSSFIAVDDTTSVIIPERGLSRQQLMQNLAATRESVSLSLGLVARVYLAQETKDQAGFETLNAQALMTLLAPEMPQELLRSLTGAYLLGIHSFDGNQPLLIFSVDSFEHGYAGMLAWERTMQDDLAPLFPKGVATTTTPSAPFLQTQFIDRIIQNRDTRVIQNGEGKVVLLWTLLDRQTLVITTNEYTLREVVSRQQRPPVTPLP